MEENKKRKASFWVILCVLGVAVIAVCAILLLSLKTPTLVDTVASPDGKTTLSVYQQPNGTTYTIEKNTSIQGVREYVGLYFSANSRYHLFVYEDGRIGHQFYLYDYETTLSGGQNPEIPCKIAPDFQEELTQNGMWVSIAFRFQNWHETENCILLTYTYTLVDGTEVSGEIWWDVEKGTVSKK